MHYRYRIGFFVDQDGCKPVEVYLFDGKNLTDLSVLINVIQRLALVGQDLLDTNMAKHLEGSIFELRKDRHRILYAPDREWFILLSAFTKMSQKTPSREIDLAMERFENYKRTKGIFELKLPDPSNIR